MTNQQASSSSSAPGTLEWLTQNDARDIAMNRRGRITASVLLTAAAAALVVFLGRIYFAVSGTIDADPGIVLLGMLGALALLAGLFYANRRGFVLESGLIFALALLLAQFLLVDLTSSALPGPAVLIIPVLAAGLLGPPLSAFAVALIAIVAHAVANVQADPTFFNTLGPLAPRLLNLYVQIFVAAFAAWLFAHTTLQALSESSRFGTAMEVQREELESRVTTQSRYLQATTIIARQIVGARDINRLLDNVVNLIRDTFGYYHVQVFLLDDENEYAVLRASTGEAGRILLQRAHRLAVGSTSVIGQVTAGSRSVIARDTDTDAVHRRNELLPDTRSEMALPLLSGDRTIGALDLQSTEPDAFGAEVISILQSLADQIAIAIENARLYTQTQTSMRELEELYGEVTERSWADFLAQARETEKRQVYGPETQTLEGHRSAIAKRVIDSGGIIISTGEDGRHAFLAAPIIVRNEVVGVLGVEPDGAREWSQDDINLLQSIAERTALAVENARLYLQAQRAADRERLVNSIAAKLQRAPSLQLLLQSVAQELADALGTDNVYAEISLDQAAAQVSPEIVEQPKEAVEGQARPTEKSEEARAK